MGPRHCRAAAGLPSCVSSSPAPQSPAARRTTTAAAGDAIHLDAPTFPRRSPLANQGLHKTAKWILGVLLVVAAVGGGEGE